MAAAFVRVAANTGTSVSIDVGSQGTDRLLVVYVGDESTPGDSFQGTVSTDGKNANQGLFADNPAGVGNHTEMHYFNESDLTDTEGTQTISFSGGDSGWAIKAELWTGIEDQAPSDTDVDDTNTANNPSISLDVPAAGVVLVCANNGGTGSAGSWTSPLTERNDGSYPASAVFACASAVEASAQTGKTYTVTIGSTGFRSTMVGASWPEAVSEGIADVDSDYGAGADEFDLDDASLDVNSLGSSFAASSNDVYLSADDTLAGGTTEVDITAGITAEDADTITLDLTSLTTEHADLEALLVSDGHDLFVIVDTGSDEYSLPVTVHRAKAFQLAASANITASGEDTTAQLTAPSGKTTGDFGGGRIQDDENPGDAVDIGEDEYREDEWSLEAIAPSDGTYLGAQSGETYEFRVLIDGVVVDTYTVTPQATISAGSALEESEDESVGVDDEVDVAQGKTIGEDTGAGDTVGRNLEVARQADEEAGAVDSVASAREIVRTVTDSVGISDQATPQLSMSEEVDENVGISDATDHALDTARTVADDAGVTDQAAPVRQIARTIDETVGAVDEATGDVATAETVEVDETVGVADSTSPAKSSEQSVADDVGISDAAASAKTVAVEISESVGADEEVTRQADWQREISDDVGVSGPTSTSLSGGDGETATEAVGVSDSIERVHDADRTVGEDVGISESVDRSLDVVREVTDEAGTTDSVGSSKTIQITVDEAVGASDATERAIGAARAVSEAVAAVEAVSRAVDQAREVTEAVGVVDEAARSANLIFQVDEEVGVTDSTIDNLFEGVPLWWTRDPVGVEADPVGYQRSPLGFTANTPNNPPTD